MSEAVYETDALSELFWRVSAELGAQGWQAIIEDARTRAGSDLRGNVTEVESFRIAVDVSLGRISISDSQSGAQGSIPLPAHDVA